MVFKQSKLFDQLLWLLLIGLLHKCNNIKQICFENKNCVRFKLIHYFGRLWIFSRTVWESTVSGMFELVCPQNILILNSYAHKIITCLDQHLNNTFTCLEDMCTGHSHFWTNMSTIYSHLWIDMPNSIDMFVPTCPQDIRTVSLARILHS